MALTAPNRTGSHAKPLTRNVGGHRPGEHRSILILGLQKNSSLGAFASWRDVSFHPKMQSRQGEWHAYDEI